MTLPIKQDADGPFGLTNRIPGYTQKRHHLVVKGGQKEEGETLLDRSAKE